MDPLLYRERLADALLVLELPGGLLVLLPADLESSERYRPQAPRFTVSLRIRVGVRPKL